MSLNHEFILVRANNSGEKHFNVNNYYAEKFYTVIDRIDIHDDIISYLLDSFNWCPTAFQDNPETHHYGLDRFGVTEIRDTQTFKKIVDGWIQLFSLATENFILTGEFEIQNAESETGEYQQIPIEKNSLLSSLKNLSNMCQIHFESNENLFLVQLGI